MKKVVHMNFMHVWTIGDVTFQKIAINEIQRVVLSTDARGGYIVILKNIDISRKSNNGPNKPSFNDTHANKSFKRNLTDTSVIPQMLYVDLVNTKKFSP